MTSETDIAMGRPRPHPEPERSGCRGFTLIELLIVVIIIGLLAAIMVPRFDEARQRAHFTAIVSDMHYFTQAQELYFQQNMQYAVDIAALAFTPTQGVEVTVTEATNGGWAALATHASLPEDKGCSVFLGSATPPALPNGQAHAGGEGVADCAR